MPYRFDVFILFALEVIKHILYAFSPVSCRQWHIVFNEFFDEINLVHFYYFGVAGAENLISLVAIKLLIRTIISIKEYQVIGFVDILKEVVHSLYFGQISAYLRLWAFGIRRGFRLVVPDFRQGFA